MNELRDSGGLARVGAWVKSVDGKQLDFDEALRMSFAAAKNIKMYAQ